MCKKYSVEEVFTLLGEEALNVSRVAKSSRESIIVDGFKVYRRSMRYATFYQKGCSCVVCGKTGTYFQLDPDEDGGNIENRRHFNLYAEDGTLMTKDHILPKKWGGDDVIDNFQTMCETCNMAKGSQYEMEIDGIIATSQDNPNVVKHYINIEKAIYDRCNANHVFDRGGKPSTISSKAIKIAVRIMNVLDTDTPEYGYYWKRGKFKVEGKPYVERKDN